MYPACILHVSSNRCRYMYPICIPHVSHMYLLCILRAFLLAGVPTLQQLQGREKEMKRARTAAVQLDQLSIDLKNLALTYFQPMPEPLTLMPPSGTQLAAQQTERRRGSWGTIERHRCQPFNASPKWSPTRATKRRSPFSSLDSRANRTSPRYVSLMYLLCISSVSCVYPARLGRSVRDTCIVMYPDCILKCRHDAFKIHVS
jgi:hypothetical protein